MTTAMIAMNSCWVPRSTSALVNLTTSMMATRQAANAVVMNSPILSRLTGTPRLREASGTPPAPKIQLPTLVRSSTQVARAAIASHQMIETENEPMWPEKSGSTKPILLVSSPPSWVRPVSCRVTPMVTPRKMKRLARVTMNDGNLVRVTTRSFRNPMTSERATAARMAAQSGQLYCRLSSAIAMPLAPTIEPIDRSNSPAIMSSDTATARSEEHTSELQSRENLVCRLLLEKKKYTRSSQSIFYKHIK